MLRRFVGPAVLAAAAFFLPRLAHAQNAQALFDQGLEDMRAGRFKIGCALIKRSLEIEARPGTVFTLAECFSRAGKYASAVELYDQYIALYQGMPPDQQVQQAARAEISRNERAHLLTLVAWLTVTLPSSAPPGVVVSRDGEAFPSNLFGVATAADPGPHVFTTRAPNGPLIEQRIDLSSGERRDLVLEVRTSDSGEEPPDTTEPSPEPDEPPASEPQTSKGTSPLVYVTAGVGAVGLVTGAVAGVLLLGKKSIVDDQCHPDQRTDTGKIPCSPEGKRAADAAQNTLAPITTVGFAVGAAGAVATALILLLDDGSPSQSQTASGPMLGVGPGGPAIGYRGTF